MAYKKHENAEDPVTPFLSNIVKGDVTVDAPNRVHSEFSPWAEYAGGHAGQPIEARGMTPARPRGSRSGTGKTVTVV